MSGTRYNQFCALARAAEIIGERWTLLIIRELLLSPMRFGDLGARLDGISPALLTARLDALVENGIVRRATLPAPFKVQVYELTETGRAVQPAIRELIRWGGAPLVCGIVFIETGFFVGFFLPGDSLLITAGIFAAADVVREVAEQAAAERVVSHVLDNASAINVSVRLLQILRRRRRESLD